jgi:hypothetical protein
MLFCVTSFSSSTCLCESAFTAISILTSKYRTCLAGSHLNLYWRPPFSNFSSSSSPGATVHDEPWPLLRLLSIVRLQSLKVSQQLRLFTGWGRQSHSQPPTWRARVSLFVWIITFDLAGMGDPTSSYATAGIALRIIRPRKPHHYVKLWISTGGEDLAITRWNSLN